MDDRRNKRRCPQRRPEQLPSAVHYVGYVEDDETPESIARKFEELERIQAAARGATARDTSRSSLIAASAAPDTDAVPGPRAPADVAASTATADRDQAGAQSPAAEEGLTDEQLMQVFKQTSVFTVRSAADGNAALMQRQQQPGGLGAGTGSRDSGDELVSDEDDIGVLQSFWSDDDDQDYSEHWKRLKKLRKKWVSAPLPYLYGGGTPCTLGICEAVVLVLSVFGRCAGGLPVRQERRGNAG
jgi:hypothetical protein